MRKRHRAEEIQEIFLRKKSSLRFNSRHKKFVSIIEQKHQIYREVSQTVERCNVRFCTRLRTKKWMFSLVDELRKGNIAPRRSKIIVARIKAIRSAKSHTQVKNYLKTVLLLLPIAPITGFSWAERTGEIEIECKLVIVIKIEIRMMMMIIVIIELCLQLQSYLKV